MLYTSPFHPDHQ